MKLRLLPLSLVIISSVSYAGTTSYTVTADSKPASSFTIEKNNELKQYLNFDNKVDFTAASKGFIATWPDKTIKDKNGNVVWDFAKFEFVNSDQVLDTVNPSLRRMAELNNIHGLFKVTDGMYQVRGFDLSVMTFVRGEHGWIVIDPLISEETAAAGLKLLTEHVEDLPVTAIIFTHSHIDHFGGVWGVTTKEAVDQGKVEIVAPEGFFEHSVSENVLAGNTMSRRASFMYGNMVEAGPQGKVDGGLGKTTSTGKPGIVEENLEVVKTGEIHNIDGVEIEFQMANGSEAPAEFIFYFPQKRVLMASEVMTHTIHNISTLRGARTRDANAWAGYIDETLDLFAKKSDIMIASHHWPTWGTSNIVNQLEKTRDMYKYVHDQTLRLANQGYTPNEISASITLPDSLGKEWYNRGYYGTVSHNARATYDFYFGAWWDGNPANLNPLPPEQQAAKYVEAIGGDEKVIEIAKKAISKGEYRWAVTLLNNVTFSNPDNSTARYLEADAMEQLGYQAESGPWRNYYLVGAKELRHGFQPAPTPDTTAIASNMPVYSALESLAVRVMPEQAKGLDMAINLKVAGDKEADGEYALLLSNSVLKTYKGRQLDNPTMTIEFSRDTFVNLVTHQLDLKSAIKKGQFKVSDPKGFTQFMQIFDTFDPKFGVVTP
ncbi:alkyl/aryl-sulfatase [Photobacterium damselae]|uniref:alkyl/aryl-sulfatase n=1 Tax=Photobacterium damselae TaxID=38293 RepID=UPI000D94A8C4|nr:alkyl sulfatase dimerization domain-containing protein [Photobacterium damselae]NVO75749.1 MBL fold metallo-hydrolase [Photobacterium damselae subsp. damselae]SPY29952.1 Metallo-beta-lactamase superfamily [Photobacterium damselae]